LIVSVEELEKQLTKLERDQQKLSLLKDQVNIRKNLLNQKIKITFSRQGKKRPLKDITDDLIVHIQTCGPHPNDTASQTDDPTELVGKQILHKFKHKGDEKWYRGHVISYDEISEEHKIIYDNEEEDCYFNLMEDISHNDLIIIN